MICIKMQQAQCNVLLLLHTEDTVQAQSVTVNKKDHDQGDKAKVSYQVVDEQDLI